MNGFVAGFIGLGWNAHAQGKSNVHFFLNTFSNIRNLVYGLGTKFREENSKNS